MQFAQIYNDACKSTDLELMVLNESGVIINAPINAIFVNKLQGFFKNAFETI